MTNSVLYVGNSTGGEEEAEQAAFAVLLNHKSGIIIIFAGVIMLGLVIGNILHKHHIHWMPESLVVIFLGAGLGLGLKFLYSANKEFSLGSDAIINEDLLNNLFLPIIIFEAGWSLRNKEFLSQLPYILIFAVLGTMVCMVVVALLLMATSSLHAVTSWRLAFTYGALIAAVDPVATLATYAHLNVDPLLNILVMGEAIINDAVAITLFEVLNDTNFTTSLGLGHIVSHIALESLKLLGGSIALGSFGGIVLSWVVKLAGMRHTPSMGILYVLASAYFIYHLAVQATLSGIIAVLFAGMIMSAFIPSHLSIEGSLLCSFLLKQLCSLADMAVFLFVGIAIAFTTASGFALGGFVILFCLLGRAVATFPLAGVCNIIKAQVGKDLPKEKRLMISGRQMFMMWHAGLRGGIALVLCLALGDWVEEDTKIRLIEATTFLICAFLLVFGGTTEVCLKGLGIPVGNPPPMFLHGTCFSRLLSSFNRTVLKPMLKGEAKDVHMQGSVLKHLMKEAATEDEVSRLRQRSGQTAEQHDLRWQFFGEVDPMHVDHGWTPDAADDDRWMELCRDHDRHGADGMGSNGVSDDVSSVSV